MPGLRATITLGLSVALGGCSLLTWGSADRTIAPRPVSISAASPLSNGDAYYDRAVWAISRRDYALALDLLQRARARNAPDVRVLNAFGVVYDKLGRFDLSARYYAQALQLDPASRVVAENLAYSDQLQGHGAATVALAHQTDARPSIPAMEAPAIAPAIAVSPPPVVNASAAPAPVAVALPRPAPTTPTSSAALAEPRSPALLGRPLDIENASGRPALAQAMHRHLASRGWTPPRLSRNPASPQARTVISFPESRRTVALALSRTLPGPVRLSPCATPCEGVRLTLGADARTWRLPPPAVSLGKNPARRT
ncbi:MAG TPA: LytR C-terminal domain-containing protein [Brevundimonas sp.]|nr:LytR C-terminal domain-containing protein [Brevundimonas sp.]